MNKKLSQLTEKVTSLSADDLLLVSTGGTSKSIKASTLEAPLKAYTDQKKSEVISEIEAVETSLTSEISNRIFADQSLQNDLSLEISRAVAVESSLQNQLIQENSDRIVANSFLQTAIVNEESRALAAESALEERITNILSNIDPASIDSLTELVAAFEIADNDLSGTITTLAITITNNLNTEITSRQAAILAEQSARISADFSLQSQINQEISDRQLAVSSETSLRISGDSSILQSSNNYTDSQILIEQSSRQSAISLEQSARTTGDILTLASAQSYTNSVSAALLPVGTISMYAGSIVPTGYLFCNGSAVSRTTYSVLFAAIGTTFGEGDGSTTFNLPNPDTNANIRLIIKV